MNKKGPPPMCAIEFIVFPEDVPFGICQYLLARFILFCFFGGLALCGSICDVRNTECLLKLWVLALGLEVLGVLVALCYLGIAVIIVTELLCSLLMCGCCCCIFPLVQRAIRRRNIDVSLDSVLVSTNIVAIACNEVGNICCAVVVGVELLEPRVTPEAFGTIGTVGTIGTIGTGEVPVTSLNSMKTGVAMVFTVARVGMNIV